MIHSFSENSDTIFLFFIPFFLNSELGVLSKIKNQFTRERRESPFYGKPDHKKVH